MDRAGKGDDEHAPSWKERAEERVATTFTGVVISQNAGRVLAIGGIPSTIRP